MTIYDKDLKITGDYGIVGRSVVHADEYLGKGKNGEIVDEEKHRRQEMQGKDCLWYYRI